MPVSVHRCHRFPCRVDRQRAHLRSRLHATKQVQRCGEVGSLLLQLFGCGHSGCSLLLQTVHLQGSRASSRSPPMRGLTNRQEAAARKYCHRTTSGSQQCKTDASAACSILASGVPAPKAET